jgi:hypothetical protein
MCLSLIARERINRLYRTWYLFLETRKRTWECQNSEISVLSSIPGEGVSCSSENKRDRRTAPRPKLLVSRRRLQKQTLQHRKLSWVRVVTRKFHVAPKLSTREERRQGKLCSFRRGDQGTKVTNPKLCWVRVSVKI